MKLDNFTDLVKVFTELKENEPDSELEDGQVFTSNGEIVTL